MVLGKNIAHDMKSGAEGAHFFGALLLTFSFDKHTHGLMENVFLTFELEHFRRLAAAVPGYSWAAYCKDMSDNKELWTQFTRGLQHGLSQVDYKACWSTRATPDEILRLEFDERAGDYCG